MRFLDRAGLGRLLSALVERGYDLIGPTVRDGAIVLDHIDGIDDLPRGIGEVQGPNTYRLVERGDDFVFGWAHGPDAGKRFLFPPREVLSRATRGDGQLEVEPAVEDARPLALVGLRSCDLHAIEVQDRVFLNIDPAYARRRGTAFLVGVNCSAPGETCFCASMGTGPRCTAGFDIALTELPEGFVAEAGTPRGEELLDAVGAREATAEEADAPTRVAREAEGRMGRWLDVSDLPGLLYSNREHPRWAEVAQRCLSCTNCTMVCPTCFCSDVVEAVDITGRRATRTREWASCFSEEFTHLAGVGPLRRSREARYRQWLTHKFASWIDQFGTSGCVGCGRCITWCPVGIDVTEEIAAIRATDGAVAVSATVEGR